MFNEHEILIPQKVVEFLVSREMLNLFWSEAVRVFDSLVLFAEHNC